MSTDFKKRKINLLDNELESIDVKPKPQYQAPKPTPKKKPSNRRKKISCFFIVLIIVLTMVASSLSSDNSSFLSGVKHSYLIRQITNILSSSEKYLQGEKDDRINFVILGMGGAGHDGPYLTDTIIIVSFKPSTQEAAAFSLPRDMIVPLTPSNYRKVNSIYSIGEHNGGGGELVKEVLTNTLDMPIHYFAALDFAGFVEMIDAIGGVKIDVARSFVDNEFPTADGKYQSVSFEAGEQKMDGLTALRFARSRHGNNGEGSDFARIKRQQQILLAVKDKLTSFNTLINPKKITSLFSLFNKYTSTDVEPWEAVKLIHMGKSLNTNNIITQSIDDSPGGFLKAGYAIDGAFILQPVTGNYNDIRALVHNIFELRKAFDEDAKLVVQNGTTVPGLALQAVNHLEQMGYDVIRYGNAKDREKVTTTIYSYNEDNPETSQTLANIFSTEIEDNIPLDYTNAVISSEWDIRDDEGELADLDFLIILGLDQETKEDIEIVETFDFSTSTSSSTDDIIE